MKNKQTKTSEKGKRIARVAVIAALLEAVKIVLSSLPNIELVTLLIIVFTLAIGRETFYAVVIFVGIECCIWGVHLWTAMYLFVWPVLVALVLLFKRRSNFFFAMLSGAFGLCFGALCSVIYLFTGGIKMAFAWWVSGIPWDIVHGVSNFIICLVLLPKLREIAGKIMGGE